MATKKMSKIDEAEAKVNFRASLGIMKQNGDTAGLAKAKKQNPAAYAEWEKKQAGKKTGRK